MRGIFLFLLAFALSGCANPARTGTVTVESLRSLRQFDSFEYQFLDDAGKVVLTRQMPFISPRSEELPALRLGDVPVSATRLRFTCRNLGQDVLRAEHPVHIQAGQVTNVRLNFRPPQ